MLDLVGVALIDLVQMAPSAHRDDLQPLPIAEVVHQLGLAVEEVEQAGRLGIDLVARRHGEAADQLRVTVDLYPEFTPARHVLALALMAGGRVDEAADLVAGVPPGPVGDADRFSTVPAVVRARTDRRDVALRELVDWRAWARDQWLSPTALALLAGALGDRDAALGALDEAAAAHDPWLVFLDVDPALDEVRGDVRLRRLRARVGLDRAALVAARGSRLGAATPAARPRLGSGSIQHMRESYES